MTDNETYEALTGRLMEANRARAANLRAWLRDNGAQFDTDEQFKALAHTYNLEHEDESAAFDALMAAFEVAKATMERRAVEASEKAAEAHERSARFYSRFEEETTPVAEKAQP